MFHVNVGSINPQVSQGLCPRERPLLSPHNETSLSHIPLLYSPSPHRVGVTLWLAIFIVSLTSISRKPADPTGYGHSPSTKT